MSLICVTLLHLGRTPRWDSQVSAQPGRVVTPRTFYRSLKHSGLQQFGIPTAHLKSKYRLLLLD
jgi:hypothetical protein